MPKIMFMTTKTDNSMEVKLSEIKDYLVREQNYTEEEVEEMDIENLIDLYEMYHED